MSNPTGKNLAYTIWASLIALALIGPANASSLRQGSTVSSSAVTGALPGQVYWTYFQTLQDGFRCPPGTNTNSPELCNTASFGDNIIRLINPNGGADTNLGVESQFVCAMIYVFDSDQEMGECCGCPLSSARLTTISVEGNLTADWGISQTPGVSNGTGSIAIVAVSPNAPNCSQAGGGKACNGGCDPTNIPGYDVTTTSNLLGSTTHNQAVTKIFNGNQLFSFTSGITEIPLFDDASGDPTNVTYLQTQCGALIGNGTLGGICTCPVE
jgi:hypothetical protein